MVGNSKFIHDCFYTFNDLEIFVFKNNIRMRMLIIRSLTSDVLCLIAIRLILSNPLQLDAPLQLPNREIKQ